MTGFSHTGSAHKASQGAPSSSDAPRFADITTMGVGGYIHVFEQPRTREEFIDVVRSADESGLPLCVIGGGSNLLASDADFDGVVVRDAQADIMVERVDGADADTGTVGADSADSSVPSVAHVTATAGVAWDDFVQYCADSGFAQIEGLSGIPGTVGASVVQNIGAYGQEVANVVESVEVWDRQERRSVRLKAADMRFGYRTSLLKATMYVAPGKPSSQFFPTPRYVVLAVTFALPVAAASQVTSGQLASALHVEMGERVPNADMRAAVLAVRARKGMLEDPHRYANRWMAGMRRQSNIDVALKSAEGLTSVDLANRHSCGSFFVNPILSTTDAAALPQDAPRYPVPVDSNVAWQQTATESADASVGLIKTSAAWLIDHAGFHKGFAVGGKEEATGDADAQSAASSKPARASLSTVHTLALTNRGDAAAADLVVLARAIQEGVERAFGVHLVPEPVALGLSIG